MRDPRVTPVEGTWNPDGMRAGDNVDFTGVPASVVVGPPGFSVRQYHTDRDLAALGTRLRKEPT